MAGAVCKTCGKTLLAEHAGSFTAYMFQHNYCHCNKITFFGRRPAAVVDHTEVCSRCRKAIPKENRAGSFTAFLFDNLRCQCKIPARAKTRDKNKYRDTAFRTAERKRYTDVAKSQLENISSGPNDEFKSGDIIGGVFKINEVIGRGGMGVVYDAQQTALQRSFALKVLSPELINEQTWRRFQAEAKMLGSLHHATLVKVYDLGIHNQAIPFYSMDLLAGRTLEKILSDEGPLELSEAIDIFLLVLDGLAYAHRNNIIHRDLKPANIMVSFAGPELSVKILDFGISKLLRGSEQNLTIAGEVFGSPYYMSPEQCAGSSVDARSDIYSVGCALFESLTACIPFEGNSVEMVVKHEQELPPILAEVSDLEFPLSIEYVVAKCLEKRPDDRYQSAREMAIDLNRIKSGAESAYFDDKLPRSLSERAALNSDSPGQTKVDAKLLVAVAALLVLLFLLPGSFFAFKWLAKEQNESSSSSSSSLFFSGLASEEETMYFSKLEDSKLVFDFPSKSIGKINTSFTSANAPIAQNKVSFATTDKLMFFTNDYCIHHPKVLKSFRPDDLTGFVVGEQSIETKIRVNGIMPYVTKFKGLHVFAADNSRFSDDLIGYLNNLPNIEQLNLINSDLTANGIKAFHGWKNLTVLNYAYNRDMSALLTTLKGTDKLTFLNVEAPEQKLSDADIKLITTFKNLEHLNIMASDISDQMLLQLAAMPNLVFIDVSGCNISPSAIKQAKALNNKLTVNAFVGNRYR